MGTTSKALKLLDLFSQARPEIGLSEFARLTRMDKATVYRMLTELGATGFVEQNRKTKLYRLGPAVLRLANTREATFPVRQAAARYLEDLVDAVKETAHVTVLQGDILTPIHSHHSNVHATRVHIDAGETLPLHATASGKAVLAFRDAAFLDDFISRPLRSVTDRTLTDAEALRRRIAEARQTGFGRSEGEFERDVSSIAAPLFDSSEDCVGAVSVACPTTRMTAEHDRLIRDRLAATATAISLAWGGGIPAALEAAWKSGEKHVA